MQQPNQHAASTYRANYTSRNRLLIEWAYRSSWIIGAAVDSKADDMTKKGVRITSEIDPKRRGILESRFDELQLWDCINETLKWSRLYGGAVALILIEGQAPLTPLVLDKVGKGSFKGLAVLDRWMINPQLTRRIKALGPNLGKPEFYDIVTTAQGLPAWTVHHSRLIRMDGVKLPYQQKITENEWGMSIVERIFDRLTSYDSTSVGAAQLAYKAHLRTAKIKKLREIIAMGGKPFEALIKKWNGPPVPDERRMSLFDSEDEFETHSYSFAGLSDLLSEFKEDIAGLLASRWCVCSASRRRGSQPVTLTWRTTTTTWVRFRSEIYGLTSACYSMYCIARSLANRCRKISPLSLTPVADERHRPLHGGDQHDYRSGNRCA
jgi:phage-related protein (TIGR01555 family)